MHKKIAEKKSYKLYDWNDISDQRMAELITEVERRCWKLEGKLKKSLDTYNIWERCLENADDEFTKLLCLFEDNTIFEERIVFGYITRYVKNLLD